MAGTSDKKAQLRVAEEQRRISKQDLLSPRIRHKDVFIESLGGLVKFRSLDVLTRREIRKDAGVGTEKYDDHKLNLLALLHCIEEPELTERDLSTLEKQDSAVFDELVFQVTMINSGAGDAEEGKDN